MDQNQRMQSLNQVLKWSVEEATKDGREAQPVDPAFVEKNREIVNALFANEYEEIEKLRIIAADQSIGLEDRLEALEVLEEFAQDMNYAINFKKVGIVKTLVDLYRAEQNDRIKVMVVWILGTCMQDVPTVKNDVLSLNGADVLSDALSGANPKLRAKGVMASSALMRNSPQLAEAISRSGILDKLVARLKDEDDAVQARALFLLENSRSTLCNYFAEKAAGSPDVVSSVLSRALSGEGENAAKALASGLLPSNAGAMNLRMLDAESKLSAAAATTTDPEHRSALLSIVEKLR
eukprot:Plantae.Rhodophyta-Purpureofilum_apyrenoidigerum.ctg1233.p1 GENE.Plantae.Rhodophyta-Purpureofilum_apyrenoidigerum.ctg1233~~Plantae.Rhodophyta-Purpureofilum_apyrenoidigerum.ctg1233.p1  ORF type:complete len:293 (+),score=76.94 Plantae.Rhodophyta-Purpureofilum_apyrenoidigerum.ctg1233:218-1096(+)